MDEYAYITPLWRLHNRGWFVSRHTYVAITFKNRASFERMLILLALARVFFFFLSCQPSDALDLKMTYLGMKPRKVALAGSALTVC